MSAEIFGRPTIELSLATPPEMTLALIKAIPSPVYPNSIEYVQRSWDELCDMTLVDPQQAHTLTDNLITNIKYNRLQLGIYPRYRIDICAAVEQMDILQGPYRMKVHNLWKEAIEELPAFEKELALMDFAKKAKEAEITPLDALNKAFAYFKVNLPTIGTFAQTRLILRQMDMLETLHGEAVRVDAIDVRDWIESYIWRLFQGEKGERYADIMDTLAVGKSFTLLARSQLNPLEVEQVIDELVEDSYGLVADIWRDDACSFYLFKGDIQKAHAHFYKIKDPVAGRQALKKVVEYHIHHQDWEGLERFKIAFSMKWEGIFDVDDIENMFSEAYLSYLYPPDFPRDEFEGERILQRSEFIPFLETEFSALYIFVKYAAKAHRNHPIVKLAERLLQEKINEYSSGKLDKEEEYHFLRLLFSHQVESKRRQ